MSQLNPPFRRQRPCRLLSMPISISDEWFLLPLSGKLLVVGGLANLQRKIKEKSVALRQHGVHPPISGGQRQLPVSAALLPQQRCSTRVRLSVSSELDSILPVGRGRVSAVSVVLRLRHRRLFNLHLLVQQILERILCLSLPHTISIAEW